MGHHHRKMTFVQFENHDPSARWTGSATRKGATLRGQGARKISNARFRDVIFKLHRSMLYGGRYD
jgi:hypothetical protein